MATIRYMVDDTETAIRFYTQLLGFELLERWGPALQW
jgi:catechol 2,3-dioxygenase-like lactoylglutathione lyase family enzyme